MKTEETLSRTSEGSSQACPPFRLLLIAGLSIGLGIAANRYLNASTNEVYTGQMQVETMLVRAPVDGILQSWNVNEGDTVDPQVLLCQIGGHNIQRQIQVQEQEVARLEARHATLKAEVDVKLHEHLRLLESDIYQAELQTADLLQKKYYYEIEAMAWRDTLQADEDRNEVPTRTAQAATRPGATQNSETQLTDRQINALLKEEAAMNSIEATTAQLEICTQRLNKLKDQKQAMLDRVRQAVGISEVELQLLQAREERDRLKTQLEQQNIRSTTLGTIANFRRRPGEYVQAGEVLADMYQLNESYVVADIPSSLSHRFTVDATVKCKFPNGETRTGVVTKVAVATSPGQGESTASGPTVPLRIEPTGALWPAMPVGGHVTIVR